jgi:hypothetical protein
MGAAIEFIGETDGVEETARVAEVASMGFSVEAGAFESFTIDIVSAATGIKEPTNIAATLAAAIGFSIFTFISKLQ